MKKISVLIVDDHKLIRETWSYVLNNDARFNVVAECSNGEEAIATSKSSKPEIVLLDINMAPISGFEATKQILKDNPDTKIIGVSIYSQPSYARKMLQAGAMGYVTKNSSKDEMFLAINEVHRGERYICEEIKNKLLEQMMDEESGNNFNKLSAREIEIIKYLKQGMSSKEISEELDIALKTVEVHRYNILKKLKLKNTTSLLHYLETKAIDI